MNNKEGWIEYVHDLQNRICAALEEEDGKAKFVEDKWERIEAVEEKQELLLAGMYLRRAV